MTLKERVQMDKVAAFKSRNTELNTLLGTVIGEMDRVSKTPTDEESMKIIKKMVESSDECGNHKDVKILQAYLPEMISQYDLMEIIEAFCKDNNISEKKQMGIVMKHLKEKYTGKYDGALASKLVSSVLS